MAALALDRYAGVGWTGAFVPWGAHFKPTPVALGTLALYGLVLVVGTAALAGSIGRAVWFPVHSAAVLVFCVSLAHGAMAGSDGSTLRWVYAASGLVVVVLQFTRWLVGTLARGPGLLDRMTVVPDLAVDAADSDRPPSRRRRRCASADSASPAPWCCRARPPPPSGEDLAGTAPGGAPCRPSTAPRCGPCSGTAGSTAGAAAGSPSAARSRRRCWPREGRS